MTWMNRGGVAVTLIKWSLLVALAMPVAARAAPFRLLVLGDSIGAGYGVAPDQSFPARLAAGLAAAGHPVTILNASVSGDTTANGLARIGDAIARHPDGALIELGANDALRGVDPRITEANLDAILARFDAANIPVLILGMRAPGNWGRDYQSRFDAVFPRVAKAYNVALYPFLLDGIALDPKFNQPDLLHPNAAGAALMATKMLPYALRLVERR
ncbi:MAG TPA: arylesterase [Stellaceae bacterium]|nr:arylesterase [Stellaceae bacterium]